MQKQTETAGAQKARPWMMVTLIGALLLRAVGWIALKDAFFCGVPTFGDAVHRTRAFEILHGQLPEITLPWGSPIYPYFAALFSNLTGEAVAGILLIQALIGVGVACLCAWALAPVLAPRTRWIAALLYALNPIAVFLELRLQPTVLVVGLLLIALRLLFLTPRTRSGDALGGLVLGFGFLLQPLTFFAMAVAAVWHRLRTVRGGAGRPQWGSAATAAIAFLLLPCLICVYFAPLEKSGPTWNWSDAVGFHQSVSAGGWGTVRPMDPPAWPGPEGARKHANEEAGRELTNWEMVKVYRGAAFRQLAERPIAFLGTVFLRAALVFSGHELPDPVSPSHVLRHYAPLLQWGLYLFPLVLAAAVLGLARLRAERRLAFFVPPLLALLVVNLVGLQSVGSRWLFVALLLGPAALGLVSLRAHLSALRGPGTARFVLPAALLLLILSALDLPQASRRCEDASEDLREEAAILYRAQDRRGAIGRLQQAVRINAENSMAHSDLAALLAAEELPQAARTSYETALAIDPANERALYGLSNILRAEGAQAEAESLAVRLVALHPRNPLYLNQLGGILMNRGAFPQAKALFQRALEIMPNYQVAIHNLRMARKYEEQATTLAFPPEMTPEEGSELWRLSAEAAAAAGRRDQTAADSLTLLAATRHPDAPMALYVRGSFLGQAGRMAEAVVLLERVVRMAPGRVITTRAAAQALRVLERPEDAEALIRWSLERAADERNRQGIEALLSG